MKVYHSFEEAVREMFDGHAPMAYPVSGGDINTAYRLAASGKTIFMKANRTEHVKFRTLPEVTVASCTYQGSYTQITEVYAAVIAWMEANGYGPAAPMFNIYHVSPHETQNPDEFVTEICYPVERKA